MSAIKAIRRSPSSCLELTRMWGSTERASLEKKPSMRLSHDPCVGVNVKVKRPTGRRQPARGLARDMGGMVVENDLDRGVGRIGGIEQLERNSMNSRLRWRS